MFYIFIINKINQTNDGGDCMCKILKELQGCSAHDILQRYWKSDSIPVDITTIAQRIGIKLGSFDFSGLETISPFKEFVEKKGSILGAVFIDEEDVTILYRDRFNDKSEYSNLSDTDKNDKLQKRQRFTIAHEIAHCCLDMKATDKNHIEYRTEILNSDTDKEWKANVFAGELLMPEKSLLRICNLFSESLPVVALSEIFNVSTHTMIARLDYLKRKGLLGNFTY